MKIKMPDAEAIRRRLRQVSDHPLNEELYDLIAEDAGSERTPDELMRVLTSAIYIHVRDKGLSREVHGAYLINMEYYVDALVDRESQAREVKACHADVTGHPEVAAYHRRLIRKTCIKRSD